MNSWDCKANPHTFRGTVVLVRELEVGKSLLNCGGPSSLPAVEVDLAAACFKPGKPNYERVKWCLTDRLGLEALFVISWWPKG